jgi:hypothetical protein
MDINMEISVLIMLMANITLFFLVLITARINKSHQIKKGNIMKTSNFSKQLKHASKQSDINEILFKRGKDVSVCQFLSYSQAKALTGDVIDRVIID